MADKPKINVSKIDNSVIKLNGLFNDIIDNITQANYKSDTRNEKEIKRITKSVKDVIKDEVGDLQDFTGNNISTFLVSMFNEEERSLENKFRNANSVMEIEEIFEGSDGNVFSAFNERYKNKALLYDDLETICNQLIELDEAVMTTRDSIVTADDIGSNISRSIKFGNSVGEESDNESYLKLIETVERKMKLPHMVKNHIIPKTLKFGTYYTYVIPQSKLFEKLQKDKLKSVKTMESFLLEDDMVDYVSENATIVEIDDKPVIGFNKAKDDKPTIKQALLELGKSIEISNDDIPLPLIENAELGDALVDFNKFSKTLNKKKKNENVFSGFDGVTSTKEKDMKAEDFTFIEDCYIKLIEPKRMIPVKMLNYTIGYYYVHDKAPTPQKNMFNKSVNLINRHDEITEKDIVGKISEKIVKAFDKSYLESNVQFKDFILNALMYNDSYKKKLHFQFIPAEYVCEFKVNEDENGDGTSMLIKSLFYAKLYLAILIFNIITFISKSNDTRIHYVKTSGIDTDIVGKTQEVARDIKAKELNFTDLLNYGTMMSKVGAGRNIFIPTGSSGEKGIDFDILSGQQVDMQNDFLEMLNRGYINGTGVPSVIMNYINEADYAKTLVMANAKYLGRVINYQLDFNDSVTTLYKMVSSFTTDIPDEVLSELEYVLNPPKTLSNTNISDITSYAENIIDFLTNIVIGQEGDQPEDIGTVKDILKQKIAKDVVPMLPWDKVENMFEEALVEAKKKAIEKTVDES